MTRDEFDELRHRVADLRELLETIAKVNNTGFSVDGELDRAGVSLSDDRRPRMQVAGLLGTTIGRLEQLARLVGGFEPKRRPPPPNHTPSPPPGARTPKVNR